MPTDGFPHSVTERVWIVSKAFPVMHIGKGHRPSLAWSLVTPALSNKWALQRSRKADAYDQTDCDPVHVLRAKSVVTQ
jgi:hypothetical protein